MSESQPVELIVYGDFNCPFSALASARVSTLERIGAVRVDWRAVEHAPDLPSAGIEIAGDLASEIQLELEQILLRPPPRRTARLMWNGSSMCRGARTLAGSPDRTARWRPEQTRAVGNPASAPR